MKRMTYNQLRKIIAEGFDDENGYCGRCKNKIHKESETSYRWRDLKRSLYKDHADTNNSIEVLESSEISKDESEAIKNACEQLAAENPRKNIDLIDKRITYDGEFDNGHVIHDDWKEIPAFDAELWAKEKSLENPDREYWVKYDDIMIGSSDLQWKNGKIV